MRPSEDTYRHKGLRKKLVDAVRSKGISDEKILAAIENIPRHYFLDSAFRMEEVAYFSMIFIFGGGGLGLAYIIEEKKAKKEA